jgi:hypothetical protein
MSNAQLMKWLEENKIGAPSMTGDMYYIPPEPNKLYLYDMHTPGYFGKTTKVFIKPEKSIEIFITGIN